MTPLDKKIIGQSPSAVQLKKMIALIAPSDAPAIIYGATGSGKESPRRLSKQFLAQAGATNLIGAEELTSGAGLSNSVLYSSDGVAALVGHVTGDAVARVEHRVW